jgi:hypothetical protein
MYLSTQKREHYNVQLTSSEVQSLSLSIQELDATFQETSSIIPSLLQQFSREHWAKNTTPRQELGEKVWYMIERKNLISGRTICARVYIVEAHRLALVGKVYKELSLLCTSVADLNGA